MIRHYLQKRLKNKNSHFLTVAPSLWELPPYEIARFGGELCQVMFDAARRYISEQSIIKQRALFRQTAFVDSADETVFSATSRKNAT
jgi:hypothetical protein